MPSKPQPSRTLLAAQLHAAAQDAGEGQRIRRDEKRVEQVRRRDEKDTARTVRAVEREEQRRREQIGAAGGCRERQNERRSIGEGAPAKRHGKRREQNQKADECQRPASLRARARPGRERERRLAAGRRNVVRFELVPAFAVARKNGRHGRGNPARV